METDKGFAWIIFASSFVINIMLGGILFSLGVYYQMFLQYYGESYKVELALVCTLNTGLSFAVAPLMAGFSNMIGYRTIALMGSVVAAVGLIFSSFMSNIHGLGFTFGVLTGKQIQYITVLPFHIKNTIILQNRLLFFQSMMKSLRYLCYFNMQICYLV